MQFAQALPLVVSNCDEPISLLAPDFTIDEIGAGTPGHKAVEIIDRPIQVLALGKHGAVHGDAPSRRRGLVTHDQEFTFANDSIG